MSLESLARGVREAVERGGARPSHSGVTPDAVAQADTTQAHEEQRDRGRLGSRWVIVVDVMNASADVWPLLVVEATSDFGLGMLRVFL